MIALLPIGRINIKEIEFLKEFLKEIFKQEIILLEAIELNEKYYNKLRRQYYSTLILKDVTKYKKEYDRMLSIVDVDLYVPKLNFVFGEADIRSGICIISIYRLRQSFYNLPEDNELFKDRIKKEAVHELGHTYYLNHCYNQNCVMYFSNSIIDTDRKSFTFCDKCCNKLNVYIG